MQKLEDFLFDLIGIFVPGLFLVATFFGTTILFMKIEAFNFVYKQFLQMSTLIMNPDYPLIKVLLKERVILFVSLIICCYILGQVLSTISEILVKKMTKTTNLEIVFSENNELLEEVKEKLATLHKVDWDKCVEKNKWISIYRWANILSNKEEQSSLQLLLSKMIMNRSFFCVFSLLFCYSILLIAISYVFMLIRSSLTFDYLYLVMGLVYLIICGLMSSFYFRSYKDIQKKLSNEAVLILSKV